VRGAVGRLSIISFGIAGALAGLAGVLIAPVGAVDLNFGFLIMLGGFYAAILGGFGSLGGVVVGGFMIGIVQYVIGSYWWVDYQQVLPFVLLIGIIAVKPTACSPRGRPWPALRRARAPSAPPTKRRPQTAGGIACARRSTRACPTFRILLIFARCSCTAACARRAVPKKRCSTTG